MSLKTRNSYSHPPWYNDPHFNFEILQDLQEKLRSLEERYEKEKLEMNARFGVLEESVLALEGLRSRVEALEESRNHPQPVVQLSDDPEQNAFLMQVQDKLPINSKKDMDDFNEKLMNPASMTAAVDYFEKYADKDDYNPFFEMLFGDWVTSNVTYSQPLTVSDFCYICFFNWTLRIEEFFY
jgi:hypothetical protein